MKIVLTLTKVQPVTKAIIEAKKPTAEQIQKIIIAKIYGSAS